MKNANTAGIRLDTYLFENLPPIGTTVVGQEILLGGFSGLCFEGVNQESGALQFITHPDRGPNPEPVDTDGDGIKERAFALPTFQTRLVRFELSLATGALTLTQQLLLTRADGTPISGLPNLRGKSGFAYADELPIDLYGNPLPNDPYGADLEGIAQAEDGTFWMGDEYRPSLFHFDAEGVMLGRYVPHGSNASGIEVGVEALPAIYAQRRANRGFEAVAYDKGVLYAFIQSPLDNPDRPHDRTSKRSRLARILAFDTVTATPVAEYIYELDSLAVDRICDAVALGNGEFLAIESDDVIGPQAQKFIYKINVTGATNLLNRNDLPAHLERLDGAELAAVGVVPVSKSLYVDLTAIGYQYGAKIEGLTRVDEHTLAIINDNDFALSGFFDTETGLLVESQNPIQPVLGILHMPPPTA